MVLISIGGFGSLFLDQARDTTGGPAVQRRRGGPRRAGRAMGDVPGSTRRAAETPPFVGAAAGCGPWLILYACIAACSAGSSVFSSAMKVMGGDVGSSGLRISGLGTMNRWRRASIRFASNSSVAISRSILRLAWRTVV